MIVALHELVNLTLFHIALKMVRWLKTEAVETVDVFTPIKLSSEIQLIYLLGHLSSVV